MPGKVNPVLCESVLQVNMYVTGADATVHAGIRDGSAFEMNTAYPIIAQSLLMSIRLLTNATKQFDKKCVSGLKANKEVIADRMARNPMLATTLAPQIGYDAASKIAKEAMEKNQTILEVALRRTGLSKSKLKKILDTH